MNGVPVSLNIVVLLYLSLALDEAHKKVHVFGNFQNNCDFSTVALCLQQVLNTIIFNVWYCQCAIRSLEKVSYFYQFLSRIFFIQKNVDIFLDASILTEQTFTAC